MGNLATPKSVQKLQTALHAKAKVEAGYRFYALCDKLSLDDILAHAYAQCRSNKGAPGVDGQDFADIEAYGVERWLAELALALRQESYRPEPIRRVFIPKANGKLRDLADPRLVLVHRQLQLAHDLAQVVQRRFGVASSAQDHEIVGLWVSAASKWPSRRISTCQ